MMAGEEMNEIWLEDDSDNRNEVSDLTVDATNKNERFSSTSLMHSAKTTNGVSNSVLRVSQSFVLQTEDHT